MRSVKHTELDATWNPPFYLYHAGRQQADNVKYYNDISKSSGPTRLLFKHTLSGTGTLYVKKKRHLLTPGQMFVVERPGPYIYCFENSNESWHFEFVSICFSNPGGLLPHSLKQNPIINLNDFPDLLDQFHQLIDIRLSDHAADVLSQSILAYRFFMTYVSSRLQSASEIPPSLQLLKKELEKKFRENISIQDYSETLGISTETVIRNFKKCYGITPGQFVIQKRIQFACKLLEHGNCSIKEVSFAAGFSSQNYFSRIFNKVTGMTPKQFQNQPNTLLLNINGTII